MADTNISEIEPYSTDWFNKMFELGKTKLEKENEAAYQKRGLYRSGLGLAGLSDAEAALQSDLLNQMASAKTTEATNAANIASAQTLADKEIAASKEEAEANRESQTKSSIVSGLAGVGGTLGGIALSNYLTKNALKEMGLAKNIGDVAGASGAGTPVAGGAGTTAPTFGSKLSSNLSSLGNVGAGLAGMGLGSLVGGGQNKAFGLGGILGSGTGYLGANALSSALNLGGGWGAGLSALGSGLGNILGRQI